MKAADKTSIKRSFRIIQAIVTLLLCFLIVQGVFQWQACNRGNQAVECLTATGLPSVRLLDKLQDSLSDFRLTAFEVMFAQEKERPQKLEQKNESFKSAQAVVSDFKKIFPDGRGHELATAFEASLNDYGQTVNRIHAAIDKDFAAAMKMYDTEIPTKVARLTAASDALGAFCTSEADQRAAATVKSFGSIRHSVLGFGSASVGFALLAAALVTLNSGRVRQALNRIAQTLGEVSSSLIGSAATISTSSQTLASGSSQQAASIEETSASLEEMSSVTKRNSESARKANELSRDARSSAEKGAQDMLAMSAAMQDIKNSSDDIAKIIKTIDEIAFQTNILALNAAVEAARAGEAGMGFAVVADEVRNLAQRSAQAAKETAAKIEGAIGNTARGVDISSKVSAALNEIVDKARQVDELAAEVASASQEQTQGITQINAAVGQMDKVTQSNAASAEESAAAAQELNNQAQSMKHAVEDLLKLVGQTDARTAPISDFTAKTAGPKPAANGHAHHSPANGRAAQPASTGRQNEIPLETAFRDF